MFLKNNTVIEQQLQCFFTQLVQSLSLFVRTLICKKSFTTYIKARQSLFRQCQIMILSPDSCFGVRWNYQLRFEGLLEIAVILIQLVL